jgi:hypothetical protein
VVADPAIQAVGSRDAVTMRDEPLASHSPLLDTANHAAIADGVGRDTRSLQDHCGRIQKAMHDESAARRDGYGGGDVAMVGEWWVVVVGCYCFVLGVAQFVTCMTAYRYRYR